MLLGVDDEAAGAAAPLSMIMQQPRLIDAQRASPCRPMAAMSAARHAQIGATALIPRPAARRVSFFVPAMNATPHVRNTAAKKLYDSLGYVEIEEGEYSIQRRHQCMKRPEGDIAEKR